MTHAGGKLTEEIRSSCEKTRSKNQTSFKTRSINPTSFKEANLPLTSQRKVLHTSDIHKGKSKMEFRVNICIEG